MFVPEEVRNMQGSRVLKDKPKPYKWICTEHGIVEAYDFTSLTRRNPPPIDYDTPLLIFPIGYFKNGCFISR
jgi:hypothetical protein